MLNKLPVQPHLEIIYNDSDKRYHKIFITNRFQITYAMLLIALATNGMGSYILGHFIHTNVSTIFIYFTLLFQSITRTIRFPKILILVFGYILIQTFVINFNFSSVAVSFKHFIGILVFSISIFSFVTEYKDRIIAIIRIYYKFVFFVALIAIFQELFFVLLGISFIPQNVISGSLTAIHSNNFHSEIMGFLPRAIGPFTEPAHLAIVLLPGVYLAILVLTGKGIDFRLTNKFQSLIIIIALLFSFSLIGYFGLGLSLIFIFANQLRHNLVRIILIIIPSAVIMILAFHSPIGSRVTSLIMMLKNPKEYQYTSSALSGWAIVSNIAVTGEALKNSNYLGTGLNTHKYTYDSTIHKLFKPNQIIMELNKENANSLFLRIPSELGIPGLLAFIFFILYYRLGRNYKQSPLKTVNTICFVLLVVYSSRNGDYLSISFILFAALFYYSSVLVKRDIAVNSLKNT